jgi:uncharacterized membrane protein
MQYREQHTPRQKNPHRKPCAALAETSATVFAIDLKDYDRLVSLKDLNTGLNLILGYKKTDSGAMLDTLLQFPPTRFSELAQLIEDTVPENGIVLCGRDDLTRLTPGAPAAMHNVFVAMKMVGNGFSYGTCKKAENFMASCMQEAGIAFQRGK